MIKKGLILCFLTFLLSALIFGIVYYADGLITEFKETEKVETIPISNISTYNPNNTDGIYLSFIYKDKKTKKEYSSLGIFTKDKSYKVGDEVKVVTRNGKPQALLCQTKRGRQRTVLERAADIGYERGMIGHILIISVLITILWLPNHKTIPNEIKGRMHFFTVITTFYTITSVIAYVLWTIAIHDTTWDNLFYGALSILVYASGSIVLLTAWIINSIIRKKSAQKLNYDRSAIRENKEVREYNNKNRSHIL